MTGRNYLETRTNNMPMGTWPGRTGARRPILKREQADASYLLDESNLRGRIAPHEQRVFNIDRDRKHGDDGDEE